MNFKVVCVPRRRKIWKLSPPLRHNLNLRMFRAEATKDSFYVIDDALGAAANIFIDFAASPSREQGSWTASCVVNMSKLLINEDGWKFVWSFLCLRGIFSPNVFIVFSFSFSSISSSLRFDLNIPWLASARFHPSKDVFQSTYLPDSARLNYVCSKTIAWSLPMNPTNIIKVLLRARGTRHETSKVIIMNFN